MENAVIKDSFETILNQIEIIMQSDSTSWGKVFAISEITASDKIQNLEIPNFKSVPADVD